MLCGEVRSMYCACDDMWCVRVPCLCAAAFVVDRSLTSVCRMYVFSASDHEFTAQICEFLERSIESTARLRARLRAGTVIAFAV